MMIIYYKYANYLAYSQFEQGGEKWWSLSFIVVMQVGER